MYVPLTVGCRQLCSTWYGCHTKVIRIKIHGLLILFAKTTIARESAKLYCFCAPQFTSISEFTFGVIAAFHIRTFPGPISKRLIDIIYFEVGLIECSFVPALTLKLNCVLKLGQTVYFRSFQTKIITIFASYICEKCPSSIWCRDLDPQPLEHESPHITARPGLPPSLNYVWVYSMFKFRSQAE